MKTFVNLRLLVWLYITTVSCVKDAWPWSSSVKEFRSAQDVRWQTLVRAQLVLKETSQDENPFFFFGNQAKQKNYEQKLVQMVEQNPHIKHLQTTILSVRLHQYLPGPDNALAIFDAFIDTNRFEANFVDPLTKRDLDNVAEFINVGFNHFPGYEASISLTDLFHFDSFGEEIIGVSGFVYKNDNLQPYDPAAENEASGAHFTSIESIKYSFTSIKGILWDAIKTFSTTICTYKWGLWFALGQPYTYCEMILEYNKSALLNYRPELLSYDTKPFEKFFNSWFEGRVSGFRTVTVRKMRKSTQANNFALRFGGFVYHEDKLVLYRTLPQGELGVEAPEHKWSVTRSLLNALLQSRFGGELFTINTVSLHSVDQFLYSVVRITVNEVAAYKLYPNDAYLDVRQAVLVDVNNELQRVHGQGLRHVAHECELRVPPFIEMPVAVEMTRCLCMFHLPLTSLHFRGPGCLEIAK
ncbi:unnamed protein product [Dicrocoelium dendriticum]|nr:unnamed protein product [Dicrocoelium dendriticum]